MPVDAFSERSLLTTLATSDVEFIVVGMLAAVAQGAPVTTHDLAILRRLRALMEALARSGPRF